MDKFIARLNIDHYRKVLAAERDPERRQAALRLLAEEELRLAAAECSSTPAAAAASAAIADEDVSHLNLEYYRKRLAAETDSVIRGILTRLIAEEEVRLVPPQARKICGDD